MAGPPIASFAWRDGERLIRFGRGVASSAVELAGGPGYALLTTERAAAALPEVAAAAGAVHLVRRGQVDALAAELLDATGTERLVALGGGRVIDVGKAVAAAREGRVAAIPTTLSGAEMTRGHRHARGVDPATPRVRPAVVVNDPALSASQPVPALAASAANALGHAAEAPCTTRANPVATLAALEAARLLARGLGGGGEPERDPLALAALLAGYAIDSASYGLHHVLAQTLARVAGVSHHAANAVMLPHSLGALGWRFPAAHAALAGALGEDPATFAARLAERTGAPRLADLGLDHADLERAADAAAERADLAQTPPAADRAELLALYEAAA